MAAYRTLHLVLYLKYSALAPHFRHLYKGAACMTSLARLLHFNSFYSLFIIFFILPFIVMPIRIHSRLRTWIQY